MGPVAGLLGLLAATATATASDASPTVHAQQRRGGTRLTVTAPAGEHLNRAGPASFEGQVGGHALSLSSSGALLAEAGLWLGAKGPLQGTLRVPLCVDGGDACRVAEVTVAGQPRRRLAPLLPDPAAEMVTETVAVGGDVAAASAEAAQSGRRVLIDFGAVWCPPCNLMSAQILDDPADRGALAPFVVVKVDVDDPASWPLKDRYQIGGYPTVIVATPAGEELERLVGYPGEAQMLAWLSAAASPAERPAALESATPAQAAAEAHRLAAQDRPEEARRWLARADDGVDAHLARLMVDPSAEGVRWLLASSAAPPLSGWLGHALPLAASDPALAKDLRIALAADLSATGAMNGAEAADLLYGAASLEGDAGAQALLYGAAAQALATAMTGDPALDRGHWSFLAHLREAAGDAAGARALLSAAVGHYPEEFTFHHALGGLLLRQGAAAEAVVAAQAAVAHGYGDNRLRAVRLLAEALHADGQTGAALALLDETLAGAVRPPPELQVRTPRYLQALEDLRATLGGATAEEAASAP